MKRLLVLAALLPIVALAVPSTVTITGAVRTPDGIALSKGTISCALSQAGTADGDVVASSATFTLAAGSMPAGAQLVPNDAITPSGTVYRCTYSAVLWNGRPATWAETWRLASSPSTIAIGAITRVAQPGSATFIAGPTGPAGATGATGATGPAGPAGAVAGADISLAVAKPAAGTVARTLAATAGDVANPLNYGASGSAVTTTGSITSGSTSLSVASAASFSVGQGISVATAGAAGALLRAKITGINGTAFTLDTAAGTTATTQAVKHDDTAAVQAAIDAFGSGGGPVYAPAGTYRIPGGLVCKPWTSITGVGAAHAAGETGETIFDVTDVTVANYGYAIDCKNAGDDNAARHLAHFRIVGRLDGYGQVGGVWMGGTRSTVRNVNTQGFYVGLRVSTLGGLLEDNQAHSAYNAGLLLDGTSVVVAGGYYGDTAHGDNDGASVRVQTTNYGNGAYNTFLGVGVDEAFNGGSAKATAFLVLGAAAEGNTFIGGQILGVDGGYGVRLGNISDENATPSRFTLLNTQVGTTQPTTRTMLIRGARHYFGNVVTSPAGGGDVLDLSTDSTYWPVNGNFKAALPTSNPGAGLLWSDGGTVKVGT